MERVAEKRQRRKILGGKKEGKIKICIAKSKPQEEKFSQLENNKIQNFTFKLTQKMKHENQNITGNTFSNNDEVCFSQ